MSIASIASMQTSLTTSNLVGSALCVIFLIFTVGIALIFLHNTSPNSTSSNITFHLLSNASAVSAPIFDVDAYGIVDVHGRYGQSTCPIPLAHAVSNEAECKAVAAIKNWSWRGDPHDSDPNVEATMQGCYWLCADAAVPASACGVADQWVFYNGNPLAYKQTGNPSASRICKTVAGELVLPHSTADMYGIVDTLYTMNENSCPVGTRVLNQHKCQDIALVKGWTFTGVVAWDDHPSGCFAVCKFSDIPQPHSMGVCDSTHRVFFNIPPNGNGSIDVWSAPLCNMTR